MEHIVIPGETVQAAALEKSAGGKGANQAAAAAKAGAETYIAGKIGKYGDFLLSMLKECGINTSHVSVCPGSTGQAKTERTTAAVIYGKRETSSICRSVRFNAS